MSNQPIVNTVAYRGRRSFHQDSYHYCSRCGSRIKFKDLEWQRGLLVCKTYDCVDTGNKGNPLIGQREQNIAEILDIPTQELEPNEKLIEPFSGGGSSDDDIIF
jgi:ribosomal protein L37E